MFTRGASKLGHELGVFTDGAGSFDEQGSTELLKCLQIFFLLFVIEMDTICLVEKHLEIDEDRVHDKKKGVALETLFNGLLHDKCLEFFIRGINVLAEFSPFHDGLRRLPKDADDVLCLGPWVIKELKRQHIHTRSNRDIFCRGFCSR